MRTSGKRAPALVLAVALLWAGSVGAEDAEKSGGEVSSPYASLFPFGARTPGPPDAERTRAVAAGLRWLAAHQSSDGRWETATFMKWCDGKAATTGPGGAGKAYYDAGVTGLAACAFLAAGHTHQDGTTYARVLAKALAALVAMQDAEGCIGARTSPHFIYSHAFGTLALVEAFGETGDERLLAPARKALAFAERARNPEAGWRYGVRPGDSDTSITGCMTIPFYAALRINLAVEAAGRVPLFAIDPDLFPDVRAWIDAMTGPDYGRTGYMTKGAASARTEEMIDAFPADRTESCTGIGVLLRAVLPGGDPDKDAVLLQKGSRLLSRCKPRWTPGQGNLDLYYWYYGALAMQAVGGAAAVAWQAALENALIAGQRTDTDPCAYAGSWYPESPWGADGGRVYSTAIAVLCLLTPQRFPPLPPDRSDLGDALEAGTLDPGTTVRVLGAVATYRVTSIHDALRPYATASDPRVRAAAAKAIAICDPSAKAVKALGLLLADASVEVRREAAAGLAPLGVRGRPATDAILGALDDADAEVRRHAIHALGGLPKALAGAEDRLRARLADAAPRVRIAAAGVLRRLHPSDAELEGHLVAALELSDDAARAEAAAALGDTDPLSAVAKKALEGRLGDASPRVKIAAARGLVVAGIAPATLLEIVVPCLASADLQTRRLALELVERLGPAGGPVVGSVCAHALSGATPVRVAAVRALSAMGAEVDGALAVLFAVRDHGPQGVRDAAREGLEAVDAPAPERVQALLPSLGSPRAEVVSGAVQGLGEQGADAVEPLKSLLAGGTPNEQVAALRALTAIGSKAGAAVADAQALLDRSGPPSVLAGAALFLGSVGRRARCAIPVLAKHAGQGPPEVRAAAIQALGSLGAVDGKAVAALGAVANSRAKEDLAARIEALRALATLGPKAEPALSALRFALSTKDPGVRAAAVEALAAVGKAAVPHLLTAMNDVSQDYADAAMEALGRMGPKAKKAVPKLAAALPAAALAWQWGPARALAGIGKPAVRSLTALLKDGTPRTKAQVVWALGEIGPDAKSAVSSLRRLRKDDDADVRKAAEEALLKIRGK